MLKQIQYVSVKRHTSQGNTLEGSTAIKKNDSSAGKL